MQASFNDLSSQVSTLIGVNAFVANFVDNLPQIEVVEGIRHEIF